jgi:dienelactone hydrolase
VVALAPTAVVWGGYLDGRWSSHWTLAGDPVAHVPFVPDWVAAEDPPAYRSLYEQSLTAHPLQAEKATIPVERISGQIVLVAGEDDQVWPAVDFAEKIAQRRRRCGLDATLVTHPAAGHRVLFPGESEIRAGQRMARGGTAEADAALGALAWPYVAAALHLAT